MYVCTYIFWVNVLYLYISTKKKLKIFFLENFVCIWNREIELETIDLHDEKTNTRIYLVEY